LLLVEVKGGEDVKGIWVEYSSDKEGEKEKEERPCFSLSV